MKFPRDPVMLLSFINTELRDNYKSLDDLCTSHGQDKREIEAKLALIGYKYDEAVNQFI